MTAPEGAENSKFSNQINQTHFRIKPTLTVKKFKSNLESLHNSSFSHRWNL